MNIENLLKEVKGAIAFSKRKFVTGHLRTKHQGNKVLYFQREAGESTGKYLGKDSCETIRALEEKEYCAELLKVAEQEEKILEKIQKLTACMPDYKSVFLNIPAEKRHLISPYEYLPEEKEEIVRVFNRKPVSDDTKLITNNGEHVRSKSELIIADRLNANGISYFYEDPLVLAEEGEGLRPCLYWHPDFRVQNPRTGKQYYWEHFGMLDDPDYCSKCNERLETYARYGFFPGENLIITSESSKHILNMSYVDLLIDRYLK